MKAMPPTYNFDNFMKLVNENIKLKAELATKPKPIKKKKELLEVDI